MWTFAPTVKLQTTHDAGVYAYIDGAFGPSVQDHIWNAGILASAGIDFSIEPTRTYWVGPFVSYAHVFDLASSQSSLVSSHHDMNTAVVGLELAFDFPVKPKTVHDVKVVVVKTPSAPVEDSKPCPVVVPATPERNPLFVVRFEKNSSALGTAQTETLDSLAAYMQAHSGKFAVVQGRASSEGPKPLNLTLSKSRADAVVAYLAAHGVDAERMVASGAGGVGNPGNAANRNAIVIVLR
jgi:outer membrane protein OmpA-like peptidoglycan-associated protein